MRGHLDRLELCNFKSYGGNVVIGPFKSGFNCICGTNGSGKSNVMDAISFVLGVRTSQLRGNQLRDLVYRNSRDPSDDPSRRKAHVMLVYVKESGEELLFYRGITISGASEYKVGSRVVSMENYNKKLAEIGVLVKARNFLVFQNEVEGIASKSPKELMGMFEAVSGSVDFKASYDETMAEKDAAEEQVTGFWRKRKAMAAERRQYKEQKEEADKFRRLQEDVARAKSERSLFQLYHLDSKIEACRQELKEDRAALQELLQSLQEKESTLDSDKEGIASLERAKNQQQKKLRRMKAELDHMRPASVQYETEISSLTRRMKGDQISLEKAAKDGERRATNLAKYERELAEANELVAQLERDIVTAEESSVSAGVMAEYKQLKTAAATRTAALQQQKSTAVRDLEVASRQKEGILAERQTCETRLQALDGDLHAYDDRCSGLQKMREQTAAELARSEVENDRSLEVGKDREQVRARLEKTVNETTQALRDVKADLNESSYRRKFEKALETMSEQFPGVKGRLSDLCKPTHGRFREAVAVVFGKLMDAIVVDTQRTGKECINYLKEQRLGMATFIPLQDVRPRPIDESLRQIGGSARLVVDIVDHSSEMTPAVHYAAGNALVCDTLDEARHIRYEGGRRLKVCSLDGTLINKAGFMTGGGSRTDDRAGKWDRAEIDALKKKRGRAQEELIAMGPGGVDRRAAAERAEQVDSLRRKVHILEQDRTEALASRDRSAAERKALEADLNKLKPQSDAAERVFRAADAKVKTIDAGMSNLEDDVFGDFALRNNVANVKAFEEQFIQRSEGLRDKKLEAETRAVKVLSQLKYEQSKGQNSAVSRLEKRIADHQSRLKAAEENLANLVSKRTEVNGRAENISKRVEQVASEIEEKKEALKLARKEFSSETESVAETKKNVAEKKSRLGALTAERVGLLTSCKIERVLIPLKDGTLIGGEDDDDDEDVAAAGAESGNNDDVVMRDVDDTDDHDERSAQQRAQARRQSISVDGSVVIDYKQLSRRLKSDASGESSKDIVEDFDKQIRRFQADLSNLAPNMRASEHMSEVSERLEKLDQEAEEAKARARTAAEAFESVKEKRLERFNACFSHVAKKISDVYKQLTKSANYPMGGTAYLSVEQQDAPYQGGIKFNAMPPTKRFRDMDQLSGGERTVAALALLFAIHDFKPSPFFILDEVDAALDTGNVSRVSSYIQSRSNELQTVVITLKDAFFERADALVGIYRDIEVNASRTLTLDLSKFDNGNDASGPPAAMASQEIAA